MPSKLARKPPRRDATVQAGAAQLVLLDSRHAEPEMGALQRSGVPGGPAAEHDEVGGGDSHTVSCQKQNSERVLPGTEGSAHPSRRDGPVHRPVVGCQVTCRTCVTTTSRPRRLAQVRPRPARIDACRGLKMAVKSPVPNIPQVRDPDGATFELILLEASFPPPRDEPTGGNGFAEH